LNWRYHWLHIRECVVGVHKVSAKRPNDSSVNEVVGNLNIALPNDVYVAVFVDRVGIVDEEMRKPSTKTEFFCYQLHHHDSANGEVVCLSGAGNALRRVDKVRIWEGTSTSTKLSQIHEKIHACKRVVEIKSPVWKVSCWVATPSVKAASHSNWLADHAEESHWSLNRQARPGGPNAGVFQARGVMAIRVIAAAANHFTNPA
jgi:hypothetical protein